MSETSSSSNSIDGDATEMVQNRPAGNDGNESKSENNGGGDGDDDTQMKAVTFEESEASVKRNVRNADGSTGQGGVALRKDSIARALQDASYGNSSEHEINETLLYRAMCAAGAWAYGVMACEVWVLDNAKGDELVRPNGGIWRDMVWPSTEALERLEDPSHPGYEPPTSLAAGEGLAGALWAEADTSFNNANSESIFDRIKASRNNEDGPADEELGRPSQNEAADLFANQQRRVIWRNVAALAADPDQPPNKRLALWAQAGFGLAAGVAFDVRGVKGIVVYMARESASMARLQSAQNEAYLISAADLIGAEAALAAARAEAIHSHRQERAAALRRAKAKMRTVLWLLRQSKRDGTLDSFDTNNVSFPPASPSSPGKHPDTGKPSMGPSKLEVAALKVKTWGNRQLTKAKGKDMDPPPPFQPDMALQTFCFAFLTLAVIFRFNKWLTGASTGDLSIMLGPVGAIATMHYTLMAAPASQPRNAIYGQLVSCSIGLCISYIPNLGTEDWIRPAVSTALAATAMVLLGITHPPGGATALSFSSGKFGWVHMALLLVAYSMAIVCSTILNNFTEKRQYPMYWSFIPREYRARARDMMCPRPKPDKEEDNNGLSKDKSVI